MEQASYWGRVAADVLGIRTNWGRTIKAWSRPRHGIADNILPTQIPLRKNPFYRQVALTYTKNSLIPGESLSRLYTQSLGITDDILDLVEDFLWKRPNVVLSALKPAVGMGLDELLYFVIRGDLLPRYCRMSANIMRRTKAIANNCDCRLFAQTCEVFEEKFVDLLDYVNVSFVRECAEKRRLQTCSSGVIV